ncbi:hypothetical protein MB27_10010 [Actinoplanes utahensis]|uniref:DUF3558 domain-containing protein n=1 Tax=Actinoplanes utahensis TaxID=1869 RepID=A0A0A6UPT7_ACTUT|nr:hypothetical protein MB27_10010 [Actinoplanes utahensis]
MTLAPPLPAVTLAPSPAVTLVPPLPVVTLAPSPPVTLAPPLPAVTLAPPPPAGPLARLAAALAPLLAVALAAGCSANPLDTVTRTPWHGVDGGCPTLSGRQLISSQPFDSADSFKINCDYGTGGAVDVPVRIMIDRTIADSAADYELSEKAARDSGLTVVPLPDVGDRAMLILDPAGRLIPATTVHAETISRNAIVTAKITTSTPVTADAAAHAPTVTTILTEALKSLQTA